MFVKASAISGGFFVPGCPDNARMAVMHISELIKAAEADGVSREEDLPFLLKGSEPGPAVLLVHGFTASPREMRRLAEFLHNTGMTCLAIRLPGHATSAGDLAKRKWEEWLECALAGYDLLAEKHSHVYAVGMSTGCLILLTLAMKKNVAGLILCSPYLKIRHRLAGHAWWLRYIRPFYPAAQSTTENNGYYNMRPVAGVHQINRLIRSLKNDLGKITAPALVMNAEGDVTVDITSGRRLYERLGSKPKVYLRLGPEAPHVLIDEGNPYYAAVFDLTARFISVIELSRQGNHKVPGPAASSPRTTRNCQ